MIKSSKIMIFHDFCQSTQDQRFPRSQVYLILKYEFALILRVRLRCSYKTDALMLPSIEQHNVCTRFCNHDTLSNWTLVVPRSLEFMSFKLAKNVETTKIQVSTCGTTNEGSGRSRELWRTLRRPKIRVLFFYTFCKYKLCQI